ncbi:MAG TPA: hypothetical protein VFZ53_12895, partial [Polyangiaceae bacterium]
VSSPALVSAYRRAEAAHSPAIPATGQAFHETPRAGVPQLASRPDTAPVAARVSPSAAVAPEKSAAAPVTPAASHTTSPVASTGATSLAEETRLLQAAQRELARKNTAAALALLEEHATRYPHGALAQERSAARVLALCDLGRTAEAREAAEAFVRASPQSPLVPRLRGSCALSVAPEHEQRP